MLIFSLDTLHVRSSEINFFSYFCIGHGLYRATIMGWLDECRAYHYAGSYSIPFLYALTLYLSVKLQLT